MLAIKLEQACSPDFLLGGRNTSVMHDGLVIPLPDRPRHHVQADIREFGREVRPRVG